MASGIRVISAREMDRLGIAMGEVMDAVETGFTALGKGLGEMPAKIGVHPRGDSFIHAMPCYLGGHIDRAGVKCISGYPTNPAMGLPYISGVMILNDPETGLPQAIMDAARITALRTGAASGVYARHFGNPKTSRVTIVGTGVQGRANLLAMKEVFPELDEIRCCGVRAPSIQRFIDEMAPEIPDAVFSLHTDLETAVRDTDVLITCTPMINEPARPVRRQWLKDDCLVIAVDYDACVGEVVNVGSGFEVSIGDTAKAIAEVMGTDIEITCEQERIRPAKSEVERLFAGNEKAKRLCGWEPEFGGLDGFKRGLKLTAEWFAAPDNLRRYKADIYNI